MSTFLVCTGLLAAVATRIYVGVLVSQELAKHPELRRRVRHAFVASA